MGQANSISSTKENMEIFCYNHFGTPHLSIRRLLDIQYYNDDIKEQEKKASTKDVVSSSHFKRILSKLNKMRLSGVLNDVTIRCKGVTLDCHSIVLIANSTYFANALAGLKKSSPVSIKEEAFGLEVAEKLLEYMYTGKIIFAKENLEIYIKAATKWNISSFLSSQKLNLAHYWNSLSYSDIFSEHFSAEELKSKQCIIEPVYFNENIGKRFSEIYTKGFPEFDITILPDSTAEELLPTSKPHAHRALLSSFSDYFSILLCSATFQESSQSTIQLENVEEQVLSTIFEFLYSGKITLNYERAKLIAVTAGWLCRDSCLFEITEQFLIDALSPSTCIELAYFSSVHSLDKLNKSASLLAFEGFNTVIRKKSFTQLPRDIMEFYLSSDELCVYQECDVFQAFLSWAIANKLFEINPVLAKILRKPLMCIQQLRYCVEILEYVRHKKDYCVRYYHCENIDFTEDLERSKCQPMELRLLNSGLRQRKESAFLLNYEFQRLMVYKLDLDVRNEDIEYIDSVWLKRNKLFGLQHVSSSLLLKRFSGFGVIGFDGKLFVTGGRYEREPKTFSITTSTYVFNPIEPYRFNPGPPLVIGRYGHSMVVVHDCIYIIGGYNKDGYFVKSVEKYRFADNIWLMETNLLTDSMNICCTALGEKIYVFCVSHDSLTMHCYSTLILNWLQPTLLSFLPEGMINNYELYKAIVFETKIYVFGRIDDDKTIISCYDSINAVWMPNFPGELDKTDLYPLVINNKLMILSSLIDKEGLQCSDTARKNYLAEIDALVLQDKRLPFNLDKEQVALKKNNGSSRKRKGKYNLILDEDTVERILPTIVVLPIYTDRKTCLNCSRVERHNVILRKHYRYEQL